MDPSLFASSNVTSNTGLAIMPARVESNGSAPVPPQDGQNGRNGPDGISAGKKDTNTTTLDLYRFSNLHLQTKSLCTTVKSVFGG
jgi:hypothetical protein